MLYLSNAISKKSGGIVRYDALMATPEREVFTLGYTGKWYNNMNPHRATTRDMVLALLRVNP